MKNEKVKTKAVALAICVAMLVAISGIVSNASNENAIDLDNKGISAIDLDNNGIIGDERTIYVPSVPSEEIGVKGKTETVTFPSSSDTYDVYFYPYWWHVGDKVYGDRTLTLRSVEKVDMSLQISNNVLNSSGHCDMFLSIDGVNVGTWEVLEGDTVIARTFEFDPITGPVYSIKIEETNEVELGKGSVVLGPDVSTLTLYEACLLESVVYQTGVPDPEEILNPLRELRDDSLKEDYVDRYYDYSHELTLVVTKDPALAYEAARLLVKYSPMVKQEVYGIGMDKLITRSDVQEIVSFTNRLEKGVWKNREDIGTKRSQEIIKFLDEFKGQVKASDGKTFSEALPGSIYYMGNIDTTPDGNNESGIASIDTTVKVPETSRSLAEYSIAVVNAGSNPLDLRDQLVAWGATVDLIDVPDITASLLSNYDLVWIPCCGAARAVDDGEKAAEILCYVRMGGGEILTQPNEAMTPECLPYTWQITNALYGDACATTILDPTHELTAGLTVGDMPDAFDRSGTVDRAYTILALSGEREPTFGCANYGMGRVIVEMDAPLGPGITDVCGDCPPLSEAMVTRMVEWVSVPCWAEIAVYTARVPNPGGILNPLRELRDDYLKEEYVDRYYDYSPELSTVITSDLALAHEAARLLVKYSPMVEQEVYGIGMDMLITSSDVEEVLSFTDRLERSVLKNSDKIDYMRSQGIIEFLDEFKEQVEASEGKTFSEALQDSIYYMGNIDTTPDGNNESGIASIDTTVKVPEASSSSGITRP